jgi:hypothetical protein
MQKLARDKQNKSATSKTSPRHKNQVEKPQKSEASLEFGQSIAGACRRRPNILATPKTETTELNIIVSTTQNQTARFFFFSMAAATSPAITEYAGQLPQNTPANTQNTQKKTNEINFFFFSSKGVPVTIKQEQNSSTEFFNVIVCMNSLKGEESGTVLFSFFNLC